MPALIRLMGGEDNFTRQLDALFEFDGGASRTNLEQGKIGEYWHGNPSKDSGMTYAVCRQRTNR